METKIFKNIELVENAVYNDARIQFDAISRHTRRTSNGKLHMVKGIIRILSVYPVLKKTADFERRIF